MSDITISVIQPPSTTINVGVDETTLIQAGIGLPPHSVTHISGGSDEVNHNLLGGLQGGSGGQYYHLSSGQYFNLITGAGAFYPNSNPSGFITGVDLTPYATVTYVTGISGQLQAQITVLNNQTGSFYPNSNPSGFITGISNLVFTTGNQTISGVKTFSNGLNIVGTGSTYDTALNISGAIKINNSVFAGDSWEAASGSSVGMANSSFDSSSSSISIYDQGIILDSNVRTEIYGSVRFFGIQSGISGVFINSVTAPNLVYSTGNQAIGGAKTFSNNLTVNGGDLFVNTSNNRVGVNTITPTATLDVNGTALFRSGLNISGTRPTVNSTGILLSGEATTQTYVTGISGSLQTQITTLNNATGSYVLNTQTGDFYANSNPSGFITGINNIVFTTGNQTISGIKTFSNNLIVGPNDLFVDVSNDRVGVFTNSPTTTLDVNGTGLFRSGIITSGNVNINGNLTISGQYNVYQQIENAKILAIAYAIAL